MSSADTYTVGHAIDALGFGPFQWLLSLAVGLAFVADAMEMMILSVMAPALHCHWEITQIQQASLTTVVFLGMMISSAFWGSLADKFGRRPTLIWASVFLWYFGLLTSFAPTFGWVLFLRFLVGFFIGGIPQTCTLYAEYLPSKTRGRAVMTMSFYWAIGACFLALLAWGVMPTLGWRYLVGFSTIPLGIFVLFSPLLPESIMYMATTGQKSKVQTQLDQIARLNRKPALLGNLVLDETCKPEARGRIQDLFAPGRVRLTLQVWFLWFVGAGTYYGVVLLTTELLNSSEGVCLASGESPVDGLPGESECSAHICTGLTSEDYVKLVWTTFAEFPGTIIALFLIDWLGRKKTLAAMAFLFAVSTIGVVECKISKDLLVALLFCARGFATGLLQTVYVYTPEAYPTNLRAVALGTGSGAARVGAMLTPYIAQVLLKASLYSAVAVYAFLGLLAALDAWFLPFETLGLTLNESGAKATDGREELVNETDDNVFKQEEGSVKPKETDRETSDQNQKATETSKY